FVEGFHESPVIDQPLQRARAIGAEQNPVRIFQKEPPGRIGLPAQLRNARRDVYVEIRVCVEPLADATQVLGARGAGRAEEGGLPMTSHDSQKLFDQLFVSGKAWAGKAPLGMP